MLRRFAYFCGALLVIGAALALVPQLTAQSGSSLVSDFIVPGSNSVKFPAVAGGRNGQVHVAGQVNREDAFYWEKRDSAGSFPDGRSLGEAEGQPDFSNATVSVGADGKIYYTWIDGEGDNRRILMRVRSPDADFGNTQTVVGADRFRVYVNATASSTGQIFVAWNEDSRFRYRTSSDGGASWSNTRQVANVESLNYPWLAAGPNGEVAIAFGSAGVIYYGEWNGSGFDISQIASGGFLSDPTVTFAPDGTPYVAWRRVEGGIFYAERQSNGSWGVSRLLDGTAFGKVSITADTAGNLHLSLVGDAAGQFDMYYLFKPAGGNWNDPVRVVPSGGGVFNGGGSATVSDSVYGHAVAEQFTGSGLRARYFLFRSGPGRPQITPVVGDDAPVVDGDTQIKVSYNNVTGNPTEMRWRWGAAPTDEANDSAGWQPYAQTFNINPPAYDPAAGCLPTQLFVQVRDAGGTTSEVAADAVTLDGAVQAGVRAVNPFIANRSAIFTPMVAQDVLDQAAASGASNGDPIYTRAPVFYLEVSGAGDCSGLREFAVGTSAQTLGLPFAVNNNFFANVIPFPDPENLAQGPRQITIRVTDNLGNVSDFTTTLIYDAGVPELRTDPARAAPLPLTVQPGPAEATVLARMTFTDIDVFDEIYSANNPSGRGLWGVWLAVSRAESADPLNDPNLTWTPVQAPGTTGTFDVINYSLLTGLTPDLWTPGTYFVYARFLDGAGNPTPQVLATSVELDAITVPRANLPLVVR